MGSRFHITVGLIYALSLLTGLPKIIAQATNREPAALFDQWSIDQSTNGVTNVFASWRSPSGEHCISLLKSIQDDGPFVLLGYNKSAPGDRPSVLGYGMCGAEVRWFSTAAGEIAIIDNQIDNGKNELLVVVPRQARKRGVWSLVYRTPEGLTVKQLTVAHCYWRVVRFDPSSGNLRLEASWDYSNTTHAQRQKMRTDGVYDIPIFYGYRTSARKSKGRRCRHRGRSCGLHG
jgi:hypothetical protein